MTEYISAVETSGRLSRDEATCIRKELEEVRIELARKDAEAESFGADDASPEEIIALRTRLQEEQRDCMKKKLEIIESYGRMIYPRKHHTTKLTSFPCILRQAQDRLQFPFKRQSSQVYLKYIFLFSPPLSRISSRSLDS